MQFISEDSEQKYVETIIIRDKKSCEELIAYLL
jgi:hypothetical protein